jgi:hypothetical protein
VKKAKQDDAQSDLSNILTELKGMALTRDLKLTGKRHTLHSSHSLNGHFSQVVKVFTQNTCYVLTLTPQACLHVYSGRLLYDPDGCLFFSGDNFFI